MSSAHPALLVLTEAGNECRRPRGRASRPPAPRPRALGPIPAGPPRGPAPARASAPAAPAAPPAALGPPRCIHSGGAGPLDLRPHLRPRPPGPGRPPGRRPPEPRPCPGRRPPLRGRAAVRAVPDARLAGGSVLRAGPRLWSCGSGESCSLPAGRTTSPGGRGRAGALGLPRDAGGGHDSSHSNASGGCPLCPPSLVPLGTGRPGHRPPGPVGGGRTSTVHGAQGPGSACCPGDLHAAVGPVRSPGGTEEGPRRTQSQR